MCWSSNGLRGGGVAALCAVALACAGRFDPERHAREQADRQLLAKVERSVAAGFEAAFANPERADYTQLFKLRDLCRKHAAELRARPWGRRQEPVEKLAAALEQTAGGIDPHVKVLSQKWSMGGGLPPTIRAKDYSCDIAFLRKWEQAVNDAIAEVRTRGLEF